MVNSLKDLEKLIKIAQKNGVLTIKLGEIEIKLSEQPRPQKSRRNNTETNKEPETETLTDEELLFWSVPNIGAQ